MKLKKVKPIKATFKLPYERLPNDPNCVEMYASMLKVNIITCIRLEIQSENH